MSDAIDLNAVVDTYDIDNVYENYKRVEFLTKLEKYVNLSNSSILELGSATGRFTLMLSKIAREVVAVDGSSRFIDIAKKTVGKAENVTFLESYFEDIHLDRTFECLIMHHILEHVSDPKLILARVKKFLGPNGIIAVSVPNAHSLSRQLAVRMGLLGSLYELTPNDLRHGHMRVYDWDMMQEQIVSAGFEIIGRHGLSFKLFSDKQNVEMLHTGIIGEPQIKGLWKIGDEYAKLSGAIMIVAKSSGCVPAGK